MQSSTGQYSTQAGEPAQPVQHSVMTASSLGFFLRAVMRPFERGSIFSSSGTIPGVFVTSDPVAIEGNYILGSGVFKRDSRAFQPLKSMRRSQSSLRDSDHLLPLFPALKRWASIGRPFGTSRASSRARGG